MQAPARSMLCAWLLLTASGALANDATYSSISIGSGRETLSGGAADWTNSYIDAAHQFSARKSVALRLSTQQRFGLRDDAIALSAYLPIDGKTTFFVEAINSPQHQFLVRNSLQVQLTRALGDGYGLVLGLREAHYASAGNGDTGKARVTIGEIAAERYFADYRAAFSLSPSRSTLAGNAMSYRFTLARYYGTRSNVQLVLAQGTELDRVRVSAPVISTKVRAATVYGRHEVTGAWSLDYAIGRSRRADVTHNQFNVGATFRFK
jgi:YaiO family outer membrane protein